MRGVSTPGEATLAALGSFLSSMSPMGGFDSGDPVNDLLRMGSPTVADPLLDLGFNQKWSGGSIKPEGRGRAPKPPSELYWDDTSQAWVSLSKTINEFTGGDEVNRGGVSFSPNSAEHLFTQGGGGALRSVVQLAEATGAAMSDGFGAGFLRLPLVRDVVVTEGERKWVYAFRKNAIELEYLENSLLLADSQGRKKSFTDENIDMLDLLPALEKLEKKVRKLEGKILKTADEEKRLVYEAEIKDRTREFNRKVSTARKRTQ
jgi:hypothetical protein